MSMSLKTVGADADACQASRFASRAQAPAKISPDAKASALRVRRGGIRGSSWGTHPGREGQAVLSSWQPPTEDETNSCRAIAQPPAAAFLPMPASGRNIGSESDAHATGRTCQDHR